MSITGGIKFLERSKCLFDDGTTINASSGTDSANRIIDRNPITYWRSVDSTDAVTEEIEIEFMGAQTFDRIFILDHNWESYNIQYFSGGSYTHFASVTGINGSMSNITETVFSKDTAYYEFTEVTSTKIRIQITTTQTPNEEKYGSQIIVTSELGTLVGHPIIKNTELDRQNRNEKMLSGRILTMKSDEVFQVALDFKDYPRSLSDDIDLMFQLHDFEQNFLIWLCGGKFGSTYFGHQVRGYRLRDVHPVQLTGPVRPIYSGNVFQNSINLSVVFEEAVDI